MSGRGVAFDDLDNDGRIDVVILNSNDRPTILRNESVTGNHWIQVRLRGVNTNRDGVGARVYVVAGDLQQMDEVHSGRGYQSHWGTRLHFGLAKNKRVKRIEVHWPRSGLVDILEDVPADQMLTIAEGSAVEAETVVRLSAILGRKVIVVRKPKRPGEDTIQGPGLSQKVPRTIHRRMGWWLLSAAACATAAVSSYWAIGLCHAPKTADEPRQRDVETPKADQAGMEIVASREVPPRLTGARSQPRQRTPHARSDFAT